MSRARFGSEKRLDAGSDQLRRRGFLALPAALLREEHGLLGRDARAAGGRHRRLAQRLQQLPPAFPRADRGGEARRARRGRPADRIPHRVAGRGIPQPDLDDVPQPDVDRRRGNDPRAADVPAVQLLAGPMMPTSFHGERLGACTDCRRFWALHRAGKIDEKAIEEVEGNLATTAGTCAVMGTASTMASIAEALGMILPGSAAIPAVHADRLRAAEATGARAVRLIGSNLTPDRMINAKSVENALRVLLALGGSTNAVIHLTAIAGRAGVKVSLDRINELSDTTPVLVNLKPVGNGYMEDFFASGGMAAVLRELKPMLHLDCVTITGETLAQRLAESDGDYVDRKVVRPLDAPLQPQGGLVALFGSLAPRGAILK